MQSTLSYSTSRPASFSIVRQLLVFLLIFSLPVLTGLLFSWHPFRDSYYWIAGGVFLVTIVRELEYDRLLQLDFDTVNNRILFTYKSLLSATKQKQIPLNEARLEVVQFKWKWLAPRAPVTLYFLKNKVEVFQIYTAKDGFSPEALTGIIEMAKQISLPVTYV